MQLTRRLEIDIWILTAYNKNNPAAVKDKNEKDTAAAKEIRVS